jgi:hypothetical protein
MGVNHVALENGEIDAALAGVGVAQPDRAPGWLDTMSGGAYAPVIVKKTATNSGVPDATRPCPTLFSRSSGS